MHTYVVSYDLHVPRDYGLVIDFLSGKSTDAIVNSWKPTASTFVVETELTASELGRKLDGIVTKNDEVLIIDLGSSDHKAMHLQEQRPQWLVDNEMMLPE